MRYFPISYVLILLIIIIYKCGFMLDIVYISFPRSITKDLDRLIRWNWESGGCETDTLKTNPKFNWQPF